MTKKPKQKSNIVYLKRGDQVHKLDAAPRRFALSAPMVFTILLIFFGALSSAAAAAHMANTRREVTTARHARDAALDANRTLASQLPAPLTNEEIERRAFEMGMARPDPSQIIYIYVPPVSHVVFNPYAEMLPRQTSFWEEMRVFVTDIVNRVFGG